MYLIVEMEIAGTVSANKYIIVTRVCLSFYTSPSRGKYTEATVKIEVLLFQKNKQKTFHICMIIIAIYCIAYLGGEDLRVKKILLKLRN